MQTRRECLPCGVKPACKISACITLLVMLAWSPPGQAQSRANNQPLQVSLIIAQPTLTAPFPVQAVLHFHNSGDRTLWLYQPVTDASAVSQSYQGSTLAVNIESASAQNPAVSSMSSASPPTGTVLRAAGFPHPRLIAVKPGSDAEENVVIDAVPALLKAGAQTTPLWGDYRISVAYSANYPNGDSIRSNLGVDLWSGFVSSNIAQINLQPPGPSNRGMISGAVRDHDGRMSPGILVSLANDQQRLQGQAVTGYDGGFRFNHLPFGRYWITVRRPGAENDTSFFEHADLSRSSAEAQMKLILLNPDVYRGKQMRHKPVFLRIADSAGHPAPDATLHILWSDGTVTSTVSGETDEDGLAVVNLLPGTNYITLRKHHCSKKDETADVADGSGIDGFSFTYNCKK